MYTDTVRDIVAAIYEHPEKAFEGRWKRGSTAQRCSLHLLDRDKDSHDGFGGSYILTIKPYLLYDGSGRSAPVEVIELYRTRHNLERTDAITELANIYGIACNWTSMGKMSEEEREERERRKKEKKQDIEAVEAMARLTPDSSPEAEYLRARGISDEIRRAYDIFAVTEETAPILAGIYMRHQAEASTFPTGVTAGGSHTVGVPIYEGGHVVAIYFRSITSAMFPKYKAWNLTKGSPIMFGLRRAAGTSRRSLVIVEGVFDVVAAQTAIGELYDVAGYLSSALTADQARAVAEAGYRNVIHIVDYDGRDKTARTVEYVKRTAATLRGAGLTALVADLIDDNHPDDKQDSNSFIQMFGEEPFTDRIRNARHATGYISDAIARAAEYGTDEERTTARHDIIDTLVKEPSADVIKDVLDRDDSPTAKLFGDVKETREQLARAWEAAAADRKKTAEEERRKEAAALYAAAAEFTRKHEDEKAAECVAAAQAKTSTGEQAYTWSIITQGISRDVIYKQLEMKADGFVTNWGVSYDGTEEGRTFIVIPPAAITTVTARTGHGKTKLLMNLALSYLEANEKTRRHVVIVPYEEDASDTVVNLINLKAAVHLRASINGQTETDNKAIIAYKLRRREPTGVDVVEEAREYVFDAIESGRLIILEDEPTAEDIRRVTLDGKGEIAALLIDYLQQVTTTDRRAADPKNALVVIMRTLNSIARGTGTPVIAASQFNRECFSPVEMSEDKNAAASNIEWGSSQNLGLFSSYRHPTSAAWKANGPDVQAIKSAGFDPENPLIRTMFIKVLKGRQRGQADQWGVMTFDGNTGRIGGNFK